MKKTDNKKKQYRFSIIPDYIKKDKRLSSTDKLLYGEILSLSQTKGHCYANNYHFEILYNLCKSQVSKTIQKLHSLNYVDCQYGRGNSRKIFIIEKLPIVFESETSDTEVYDDVTQVEDLCDSSTIGLTLESKNNRKKIDTNKRRIDSEEEKRDPKVSRHSFLNKDQLESKLLDALSVLYNRYRHFDLDSIISSIDIELEKDTCRENISQLGFKDWFLSVLKEEELTMSDEKISEEDFYSLSGMFLDQFYDVLTD